MLCLVMGILCMSLATLYIPVVVIKARKFALLFSFGSVFFLSRSVHASREGSTIIRCFCFALQFLDALGTNESSEAFDQYRTTTFLHYLSGDSHRYNLLFGLGKWTRH